MRSNANLAGIGVLLIAYGCGGDGHPKDAPTHSSTHTDASVDDSVPDVGPPDAGTSSMSEETLSDGSDTESGATSETNETEDTEPMEATEVDAGIPPLPVDCADAVEPGNAPLRRLSRVEYGNTLFQLFGDVNYQRLGLDHLVKDGEALGFSNQASVLSTSPLLAGQYMDIATTVAEAHADDFESELGACLADATSSACEGELASWIGDFGQLVYRRPLQADEVSEYASIYDWEVAERGEHREGVKRVLETLLQSPHFLYRPEFGVAADGEDVVRITSWEMASRLSYLFWNTMPDVGLFEAAAADELRTTKQIEAAARRLLKAPRARLAFRNFHTEWLDLEEVLETRHNGKDLELFPDYDDSIPPELFEETLQFLDYTVFEGDGSLQSLLTAPLTRINRHTAAFYGIEDGPSGDAFETVQLDPERYAGFLTQAGLLMAHSTKELSSPIHRGLFIRTSLLCQPPPPPPPNIPPPPKVDRSKTTREQYAAHSENPTCAACHQLMDPIGLAFEHFDAMGRYRETEWGKAIDAAGVIYQADAEQEWIVEAEFDGVVELGAALAASERVKQCVARQWFRFAMGRGENAQDECSMQTIDESFESADYDLQELVLAITKTPAFRYIHRSPAP